MAKKKFYRYPLYLLARITAAIFCLLPRRVLLRLAQGLGRLAYGVVVRQSRKTLKNLREAFGTQKSEKEIRKIAEGVFENFSMTAAEILRFRKLTSEKVREFVEVGNTFEVYDRLLREGKGVISMTAHLGNWELLAGVCCLGGCRGGVIARRIYYEPFNRWIVDLRKAVKVRTLYRDESIREILEILSRNEIIGILPDQDVDSLKGIFVPFFGKPAYTTVAPVRLSLASGSPIVVSFVVRTAFDRYRFFVEDVIRPVVEKNRSREEAVEKYTALWMKRLEEVIRRYPEQWAWMHDRWKTKPPARLSSLQKEAVPSI